MLIDRKPLVPETSMPVAELCEDCMACKDSEGAWMELIQMRCLPDFLAERREERS